MSLPWKFIDLKTYSWPGSSPWTLCVSLGQALKSTCRSKELASIRSYQGLDSAKSENFGKLRFVASHESVSGYQTYIRHFGRFSILAKVLKTRISWSYWELLNWVSHHSLFLSSVIGRDLSLCSSFLKIHWRSTVCTSYLLFFNKRGIVLWLMDINSMFLPNLVWLLGQVRPVFVTSWFWKFPSPILSGFWAK